VIREYIKNTLPYTLILIVMIIMSSIIEVKTENTIVLIITKLIYWSYVIYYFSIIFSKELLKK